MPEMCSKCEEREIDDEEPKELWDDEQRCFVTVCQRCWEAYIEKLGDE
jgi:hypothetical protein